MKKLLVPIMVLALVAITVPVWAVSAVQSGSTVTDDTNLSTDVSVTKCVFIGQLRLDGDFTLVTACLRPNGRADAEVAKTDVNACNVWGFSGIRYEVDPYFNDKISYSFNEFHGIGQANQAAGSMNNQGNVVAAAYVNTSATFASALATVGAINTGNAYATCFFLPVIQHDEICGSFTNFYGIGQVNQSAGSMNNQNNVVAVAAGNGAMVAMAGAELAMNNAGNNFVPGYLVCFDNKIDGSFNSFHGVGQVNQSAGNMNNQVNVISAAASITK